MISYYERNVLDQPEEWKRLLRTKLPRGLDTAFNLPTSGRLNFAGIGSSYWAARFSEFLWRDYVDVGGGRDPVSFQSFDFIRTGDLNIRPEDIVIVFSHRGTKTFSMQSLEIAKKKV